MALFAVKWPLSKNNNLVKINMFVNLVKTCSFVNLVMNIKIKSLFFAISLSLLILAGCGTNQSSNLVGNWTVTRMDALPGDFPIEQWEFTADNDLLKYVTTEFSKDLKTTGRWSFNRRNRVGITNFDKGFNGEWEIVSFKADVLRMVLKVEKDGKPAGQVLREFTRTR